MLEFKTSDGSQLEARVVRLNPLSVIFELCGPEPVIRSSDVLEGLQIWIAGRLVYQGKATVSSVVNDGARTLCEAGLGGGYTEINLNLALSPRKFIRDGFEGFLRRRAGSNRIDEDYREAVGELRALLYDLSRWLDEVELASRNNPPAQRAATERQLVQELAAVSGPSLASAFERFEIAAAAVERERLTAHYEFCRRELHPFLMASPFMHRIFSKPLGYAGDYEMVSMILRDPHEGGSLFARLLNVFILDQSPARAHRNRVEHLFNCLVKETARVAQQGRSCRVYNLGCGPAGEVQRFMTEQHLSSRSEFTLLDANEETLQSTKTILDGIARERARTTRVTTVKRTVQQLLKGGSNPLRNGEKYDFIYSAGLFDYLNDRVCKLLIEQCYDLLAPGGLLLVTNVDSSNPIRNIMEHIYEWFLIYRNGRDLEGLAAGVSQDAELAVHAESTSSNLFLELRKPVA